ncbi:hypothetical protein P4O66_003830 [Electrophorus voltai]|uniref:Uncharacterized protein n=1 Tax=Electrophorus voltai TaxID=2609070 RepID=A0AAD8ZRC0_9TELE|nr:hypothetical protein P4O66_003830 [Electrophorus voltai]
MIDGRVGFNRKLAAKYEGPYTDMSHINEVTYHVGLLRNSLLWAFWAFHVSALKPVVEGPLSKEVSPSGAPPPPLMVERGLAYKFYSSCILGYL